MAARRDSRRPRRTSNGRDEAEQQTRTDGEERQGEERSGQQDDAGRDDSGGGGIFAELKDVASDAALAVLAPVAKKAATQAAKFAVSKGPELMEDKILPKLADAGGPAGIMDGLKEGGGPVGGLLSKVTGGGDEDEDGDSRNAGDGTGKGRRMPIQQAVDVAAPIDIVYDQFTLFEDFPKFMHRVQSVSQKDDAHVEFHEKVWGFKRSWEAEIVEQRPDERIVWESQSGLQHVGVVTFHELAERLTRLEVNIDIDPSGPMEKIARGARFAKRAVRADLKRFKAYVEMHEDADGGWEGEIEDGEVVEQEARQDEDQPEDEMYEDEGYEEPEDEAEEEPADEAEEEPEDEAEEEPEDEASADEDDEAEQEEEKPKPKRRQPARSRSRSSSNGSNGSSKSKAAAPKSRSRGSSSKSSSSNSRSGSSSSRSRSSGGGTKSRAKSTSGRK